MNDILKMLPKYYYKSNVMTQLTNVEDAEIIDFSNKIEATLNQFFINSATYGLEKWEKDFDIKTDITKSDIERQENIKSKIRGVGTVTISFIQNIANSFQNGTVNVIDNSAANTITVQFADVVGTPPNINNLKAAIEMYKPAHLAVIYTFRYYTLAEINAMTLSQINSILLNKLSANN